MIKEEEKMAVGNGLKENDLSQHGIGLYLWRRMMELMELVQRLWFAMRYTCRI